jgi:hypothetical protein
MDTPMGERKLSLTLAANGSELTGTISNGSAETPIHDGHIDGDKAIWKTNITSPMPMTLEFTVTAAGDELTGSVKLGAFGIAPLQGTRT